MKVMSLQRQTLLHATSTNSGIFIEVIRKLRKCHQWAHKHFMIFVPTSAQQRLLSLMNLPPDCIVPSSVSNHINWVYVLSLTHYECMLVCIYQPTYASSKRVDNLSLHEICFKKRKKIPSYRNRNDHTKRTPRSNNPSDRAASVSWLLCLAVSVYHKSSTTYVQCPLPSTWNTPSDHFARRLIDRPHSGA